MSWEVGDYVIDKGVEHGVGKPMCANTMAVGDESRWRCQVQLWRDVDLKWKTYQGNYRPLDDRNDKRLSNKHETLLYIFTVTVHERQVVSVVAVSFIKPSDVLAWSSGG